MSSIDQSNLILLLNQERLSALLPVNELDVADRQKLADKSRIDHLPRGAAISVSDEHRWFVYLLEGCLELVSVDKATSQVIEKTPRSNHPVFSQKAHNVRAIAEAECIIVRFDRQYFNTLLDQELLLGEEVETIEVSESESYLFNTIMHAFNQGELKLPSLPEIALKVKEAVSDPDVSTDKLTRILEADPSIVARLIQVANSPINQGVTPVTSIRAAVIRLGLATTRDLVLCLSVKQLFKVESTLLMNRMLQLYEHSIEVAAIAYSLAKKTTHLAPDDMLLAGLVHDIGVIPILTYIDQTGLIIESLDQVEEIISDLRTVVGSMVISHWALSPELLIVVENAENWGRDHAKKADMCDVILAAQIYFRLQHHQLKDLPTLDHVPAFQKLFPEHQDPNVIKEILDQAKEEVDEVKRLLRI